MNAAERDSLIIGSVVLAALSAYVIDKRIKSSSCPISSLPPNSTITARSNAAGQQVSIAVSVKNGALVITARPQGFQSPVYSFWVYGPSGTPLSTQVVNGWSHIYGYGPQQAITVPVTQHGCYYAIVYARESSAPGNEYTNRAIQQKYEANSAVAVVTA